MQDTESFCYGIDAVLLAAFAKDAVRKGMRVLDLCTGNGIVPLLLAAKTEARELIGLEVQERAVALAKRSIAMNREEERMQVLSGDLCRMEERRETAAPFSGGHSKSPLYAGGFTESGVGEVDCTP